MSQTEDQTHEAIVAELAKQHPKLPELVDHFQQEQRRIVLDYVGACESAGVDKFALSSGLLTAIMSTAAGMMGDTTITPETAGDMFKRAVAKAKGINDVPAVGTATMETLSNEFCGRLQSAMREFKTGARAAGISFDEVMISVGATLMAAACRFLAHFTTMTPENASAKMVEMITMMRSDNPNAANQKKDGPMFVMEPASA